MEVRERSKRWKWALCVLCTTGLMKGFSSAGGPFQGEFVGHPNSKVDLNLQLSLVDQVVLSAGCSFLILLIITDALNYRYIIILGTFCSTCGWILFTWFSDNVTLIQIRAWLLGIDFGSTELSYFTYAYALFDNKHRSDYRRVTALTSASLWVGESLAKSFLIFFSSSLSGQERNYFFLSASVASVLLSIVLPKVLDYLPPEVPTVAARAPPRQNQVTYSTPTSVDPMDNLPNLQAPSDAWYFKFRNRRDGPGQKTFLQKMKESPSQTKLNLIAAYTNPVVIKWSVWYVLGLGIFLQVATSPLASIHQFGAWNILDLLVSGVPAVLGICLCLVRSGWSGRLGKRMTWKGFSWGIFLAGVATLLGAVALFVRNSHLSGTSPDLNWVSGCYILFRSLFLIIAVLAKSIIAAEIRVRSAAFIFGINSLLGIFIYAGFHILLKSWWQLGLKEQSLFLAWTSLILGLGLLLVEIVPALIKYLSRGDNLPVFCKRERPQT